MDIDARIKRLRKALEGSDALEQLRSDPGSAGGFDDQHDGQGSKLKRHQEPHTECKDWEIMGH